MASAAPETLAAAVAVAVGASDAVGIGAELVDVVMVETWLGSCAAAGAGAGRGLPVGLQRRAHCQGANRGREGRPGGAAQEDRQ